MRQPLLLRSLQLCLLAVLIRGPSAEAQDQAIFIGPGGAAGANNDQTVGWQFNVPFAITVNGLGWYDFGSDGLSVGRTVGIWAPDGTLLVSAFIPGGTSASLNGQFRTISIPDRMLSPGTGYIIGGQNFASSTDPLIFSPNFIETGEIEFVHATFSDFSSSLVRPTQFSSATLGFFGPGFTTGAITAAPEPTTFSLFVIASLLTLLLSRRVARPPGDAN